MQRLPYIIIIFGIALMVSVTLLNVDWHRTAKRDGYGTANAMKHYETNRQNSYVQRQEARNR